MNKRILALLLLVLLVWVGVALAVPPIQITASDGSASANVDDGKLYTIEKARYLTVKTGSGLVYTGACNVLSINTHSTAAWDSLAVYDNVDGSLVAGELRFELGISAANSSVSVDAKGYAFTTGIYIMAANTAQITTVTYDY